MSAVTGYYTPAGQGWRLAYSLVTLAHELAAVYGEQLTCLGTVGDVAHAAENMGSDHNPFIRDPAEPSIGIVRAIDLGGSDSLLMSIREHVWTLYAAKDPRVYYYGYSKGCSDNLINNWGLPFGTHIDTGDAGHLHISVTQVNGSHPSPSGYVAAIDSTASWGFSSVNPSGGGTLITALEDDLPTIVYDLATGGARVAVIFGNTIKQISDGNETVDLEKAASAAGVPANTPVIGVPTATYNDYIIRFDTYSQNQAVLAALAELTAAVQAIPAGPAGSPGSTGPLNISLTGTATPEATA